MLVLAGDIGGTNTRLCLVETDGNNESTLREEIYPSGNQGLVPLVQKFLGDEFNVHKACFALAGPVLNNKCKITNLPWPELDAVKLQEELNIAKVSLINDFVAVGYNIVLEENQSLVTLQPGEFLGNVLDLWSTFLERCQRTNCNWSYPQIQNTTYFQRKGDIKTLRLLMLCQGSYWSIWDFMVLLMLRGLFQDLELSIFLDF